MKLAAVFGLLVVVALASARPQIQELNTQMVPVPEIQLATLTPVEIPHMQTVTVVPDAVFMT